MSAIEISTVDDGPFLTAPGKSRRAMNWFFADRERLFWLLQLTGWLGFFFFHVLSVSSIVAGWSPQSVAYSTAMSIVGLLTTTIVLRPIFQFARRQPPALLLIIAISATVAATFAMSVAKLQTVVLIFGEDWIINRGAALGSTNLLMLLRPDLPPNLFLLMSWGGFYFGINYYLKLRDETERTLIAARLADQAQLKMLRYQLNPHFLFNTLNAISTLVLEKDGRHANEMLTKLSAFLRYSLDSDPLQKTSLAEEIRALQLYLDIEKTRFADRLKITLDVDDDVLDARVPSLILQPAIENSIKYAIAQMEAGGEISILAKRDGDMLRLQVCDNGPNTPDDPAALLARAKTGVGLINMRDRLAHLYGARQNFSLSKLEPRGLCVCLRFPFETKQQLSGQ
ncbi:MAG: histidine kinase [Parvularculaceae bacterium]|nr:histidine kinase [Parvularculaceae bacterium]